MREWLKPGDTVYTIIRHVSRSGMSRDIGVVVMRPGEPVSDLHPNYLVAKAIGARVNKRGDGVVMGGCGMDMGFALVHELSYALYPEYACPGEKVCPSADHCNPGECRTKTRHADGYALRQRWL